MTSVGSDFPLQQERIRKLKEAALCIDVETEEIDEQRCFWLEGVLHRAAQAQSSGDIIRILESYAEMMKVA